MTGALALAWPLCSVGDLVFCVSQTYFLALQIFKDFKLNVKQIPMDEDGMNMDKLKTLKTVGYQSSLRCPRAITRPVAAVDGKEAALAQLAKECSSSWPMRCTRCSRFRTSSRHRQCTILMTLKMVTSCPLAAFRKSQRQRCALAGSMRRKGAQSHLRKWPAR